MTTEYIYGLIDPTNSMISYIGRTVDLSSRFNGHIGDDEGTTKTQWIKRLGDAGLAPIMVVLETVSGESNPKEIERLWVDLGVRLGWPLTNSILLSGLNYKKSEIDRFSKSVADWIMENHSDRLIKALKENKPGKVEAIRRSSGVKVVTRVIVSDKKQSKAEDAEELAEKIKPLWIAGASKNSMSKFAFGKSYGGRHAEKIDKAISLLKDGG